MAVSNFGLSIPGDFGWNVVEGVVAAAIFAGASAAFAYWLARERARRTAINEEEGMVSAFANDLEAALAMHGTNIDKAHTIVRSRKLVLDSMTDVRGCLNSDIDKLESTLGKLGHPNADRELGNTLNNIHRSLPTLKRSIRSSIRKMLIDLKTRQISE